MTGFKAIEEVYEVGANTFGTHFQIHTFGESHGSAMGVVVDGCPAGVPFAWDLLTQKLKRRRPGYLPWVSDRKEEDVPELLSGVFGERTLGTPLTLLVRNKDARSGDYEKIKNHPRPGHADDVWKKKFQDVDYRGGGRASGRETIARVMGGVVAEMFVKTIYKKLNVQAFAQTIGPFERKDPPRDNEIIAAANWFGKNTKEVSDFLVQKKSEGLSYGGVVEVWIKNPPAGLGQPVFHKLKSDLAGAYMSIGACYQVSLGKDSSNNKNISQEEGSILHGKKDSLVYGGVRGGISTGEDIVFQLHFKAPASVLDIAKKGRHDPCIVPRVTVVVEAMSWLVLADHILWQRLDRVT